MCSVNPRKEQHFFCEGDVIWYAQIRMNHGGKKKQRSVKIDHDIQLEPNEELFVHLRVAMENTSYLTKNKKYQTKCAIIGSKIGKVIGHESLTPFSKYENEDIVKNLAKKMAPHRLDELTWQIEILNRITGMWSMSS